MIMAGKSQILPADTWARSSVMERKLEELVSFVAFHERGLGMPPSHFHAGAPPLL
jgi:hypothetical protein